MTRPTPDARSEWADLNAVWTDPAGAPATDAVALARSVRRRADLARLNYVVEIVIGVGLMAMVGLLAFLDRVPSLVAAGGIAFAGFALALTVWARRGLGDQSLSTPEQALRLAQRQARTGLKWARAGLAITVAAAAFIVLVLGDGENSAETLFGIVGAGLFLAGCALFYRRHARRCRDRLAAHERALAQLLDADAPGQADSDRASTASDARPPETTSPPPRA